MVARYSACGCGSLKGLSAVPERRVIGISGTSIWRWKRCNVVAKAPRPRGPSGDYVAVVQEPRRGFG